MTTNEEREAAIARIRAKLDRIPDSDAVTLDKADVRLALAAVSDTTPSEGWSTEDRRSAEAEAKSRWPIHEAHTFDTERDQIIFQQGCINGFMLGAEWWKATDQPAPTPSELPPLLADGLPGHDERGSDRAERETEEEPVESSASLLLGEAGVDECEGEPEERGGDVVVHASTLPATPSEPTAKVVPISYEASASCSHGVCQTGCSHLMWECKACSSEGGWGASRERLEGLASQHVCVLVAPTPSEGEREALIHECVQFVDEAAFDAPQDYPLAYETAAQTVRAILEAAEGRGFRLTPPAPARDRCSNPQCPLERAHSGPCAPARDGWEIEYAGDHGDGSYCLVDSADETRACGTGVYRHVTAWKPLPVTEEER